MSVYLKLQQARVELQNLKLKKSGKNKFAGYDYYELADFLPNINIIFNKLKLTSIFSIESNITDYATLTIVDSEDGSQAVFKTPTADADIKGAIDIQKLGAIHTYLKRYLYMNALEIVENDMVESIIGSDKVEPKKATPKATTKTTPAKTTNQNVNNDELEGIFAEPKVDAETQGMIDFLTKLYKQYEPVRVWVDNARQGRKFSELSKEELKTYIINAEREKNK